MSDKQKKAAKVMVETGKLTGKDLVDIGYSEAIAKNPHKVIKSKAVQKEIAPLLKRFNVTLEQYLKNIGDAMVANRVASVEGDFYETGVPDYQTRLSANKQAERFLNVEPQEPKRDVNIPPGTDEVELQRIVFKKQ